MRLLSAKDYTLQGMLWLLVFSIFGTAQAKDTGCIQPCGQYPYYWAYMGTPVMLLGADDEALFHWAGNMKLLVEQLALSFNMLLG